LDELEPFIGRDIEPLADVVRAVEKFSIAQKMRVYGGEIRTNARGREKVISMVEACLLEDSSEVAQHLEQVALAIFQIRPSRRRGNYECIGHGMVDAFVFDNGPKVRKILENVIGENPHILAAKIMFNLTSSQATTIPLLQAVLLPADWPEHPFPSAGNLCMRSPCYASRCLGDCLDDLSASTLVAIFLRDFPSKDGHCVASAILSPMIVRAGRIGGNHSVYTWACQMEGSQKNFLGILMGCCKEVVERVLGDDRVQRAILANPPILVMLQELLKEQGPAKGLSPEFPDAYRTPALPDGS
jgi:hypothetical protein